MSKLTQEQIKGSMDYIEMIETDIRNGKHKSEIIDKLLRHGLALDYSVRLYDHVYYDVLKGKRKISDWRIYSGVVLVGVAILNISYHYIEHEDIPSLNVYLLFLITGILFLISALYTRKSDMEE